MQPRLKLAGMSARLLIIVCVAVDEGRSHVLSDSVSEARVGACFRVAGFLCNECHTFARLRSLRITERLGGTAATTLKSLAEGLQDAGRSKRNQRIFLEIKTEN